MKTTRLKTNILFLGLAAMCVLASCKKEKENGNTAGEGFEAITEQGVDGSKTYLDGVAVKWTDDDAIKVSNGVGTTLTYSLVEGKNTSVGKFYTSENHDNFFQPDYVAIYPSSNANNVANTINGTMATFNLLNTQPYVDDGFGNKFNPMVAYSTNRKLYFKNVLGGICFPLTGSSHITSIVLTSNNTADKLWGTGVVECDPDDDDYLALNITNNATDKHVITLTCDLTLSDTPINACFMVPAGTLGTGFTLTLYDGETQVFQKPMIKDFGSNFIQRSFIRKLNSNLDIPNAVTITVSADPTAGGTVSGGGIYSIGQNCTVTATPNQGYSFVNWTENGIQVSTDASYSFTVEGGRNLVAHFVVASQPPVVTTNDPEITGTAAQLNGTLTSDGNESCTVGFYYGTDANLNTHSTKTISGTHNTGYTFNWAWNNLQFNVDYYYRAFATNSTGTVLGEIKHIKIDFVGHFLVNENPQQFVKFSTGLLWWDNDAQEFAFENDQYSFHKWQEGENGPIHASFSQFCWSHPYNDYGKNNTRNQEGGLFQDWGQNVIRKSNSTDHDPANTWRTLSYPEWECIHRNHAHILRERNSVNYFVLLPYGMTASQANSYNNNQLSNLGAAFFPMCGNAQNDPNLNPTSWGYGSQICLWTSSMAHHDDGTPDYGSAGAVWLIWENGGYINEGGYHNAYYHRMQVRLAKDE